MRAAETGDAKRCWANLRKLATAPARTLPQALRTPAGPITVDPQTIANTLQQHYARVQDPVAFAAGADFDAAHHAHIEEAVERLRTTASLTDHGPPELSGPITAQEVAEAARAGLHNHRAPNPLDRIPNELLKYGGGGMHAALAAFFNMQWELEFKAQAPGVIRSLYKRGDATAAHQLPPHHPGVHFGQAVQCLPECSHCGPPGAHRGAA